MFQNSPIGITRKKLAPKVPTYQYPIIPNEARWGETAVIPYVARGGIPRDEAYDGITREDARGGITWEI
jgi:hypothetical protein